MAVELRVVEEANKLWNFWSVCKLLDPQRASAWCLLPLAPIMHFVAVVHAQRCVNKSPLMGVAESESEIDGSMKQKGAAWGAECWLQH